MKFIKKYWGLIISLSLLSLPLIAGILFFLN